MTPASKNLSLPLYLPRSAVEHLTHLPCLDSTYTYQRQGYSNVSERIV